MHLAPPTELNVMSSPWLFARWEMDILEPFPKASQGLKYLITTVDYFTKWLEAEPLSKITEVIILYFFKKNYLARSDVPPSLSTDPYQV